MSINLPHVRARDGVFQYERRVPLHIQRDRRLFEERFNNRPLFRQSLRSKDLASATLTYGAIHQRFEALIAPPSAEPRLVEIARSVGRMVTDHDIAAIAERYERLYASPFEKLHRRANVCDAAAAELERLESNLEMDAEAIRSDLRAREVDPDSTILQPIAEAALVIEEHGLCAPEGSDEYGAVVGAVRIGIERGYKRVAALSRGEVLPTLDATPATPETANTITLADTVKRYIETRKPSTKNVLETRLALRQFEQIVGRKPLMALTRRDAHHFAEHLSNQKVGGKTTESVVRHLSVATIRKRLGLLGATVNHAINQGWFDGTNPLSGIILSAYAKYEDKAVMPDKRRLLIDELNAIFNHPWFTGCASPSNLYERGTYRPSGSEFWVPIVALFTGCRAAELGGLKVSEVKLDNPQPHFVIRPNEHRRTKNTQSRCVPILDALVDLGFAAYVDRIASSGAERLFPDWTASKMKGGSENDDPAWSNSGIIRAFNRQVIPTALSGKLAEGVRREVTFHSFRGAFKAMLVTGNGVPLIAANSVVAHKNAELDERYIGQLTIEETYPMIRGCSFKGLKLPTPPPS